MSACDGVRAQGDNNETARWSGSSMLAPRADFDYFTGCEGTRAFPVFIVGRAHACPVQSVSRSERAERRVQPRRDARPNKFPELFGVKILGTLELRGLPATRAGFRFEPRGTNSERQQSSQPPKAAPWIQLSKILVVEDRRLSLR